MESYIAKIRKLVGDEYIMLLAANAVIVDEHNRILLQKRSDNHLWGLPGGLLELDESIEQGLLREVKEETNLDVEIVSFLGVFTNPLMRWRVSDSAKVFAFSFHAKVIGGELRINDTESTELRYFEYEHLPQIHSVDTQEAIDAYYHHQTNLIEGKKYQ